VGADELHMSPAAPGNPQARPRPDRPRISAIIACYRDAPAVVEMHERLVRSITDAGCEPEIIFVNDGSPDNADEVLAGLCARHPDVVAIRHARNFGSQSAFTSGMKIATGDGCVLLDGDLQDPPEVIPAMIAEWRKGFDVVVGRRVKRDAPWYMNVMYKSFYRIFRSLSYIKIPLDAGDFSLMDRRVMDAMNDMPEVHRFMRGLRAWVGFSQTSVPYIRPERKYGRTTNSFGRNLGWARRAVISFSHKPLDMISLLALFIVGATTFLGLGQLVLWMLGVSSPKGFTTLLLVVLFLGGIQLLCLGILASYLAHIYDEVKRRPAYVVQSVTNAPSARAATTSAFDAALSTLISDPTSNPIEVAS
jgi:polyisoprenyl-phosphate glycosyltransferase